MGGRLYFVVIVQSCLYHKFWKFKDLDAQIHQFFFTRYSFRQLQNMFICQRVWNQNINIWITSLNKWYIKDLPDTNPGGLGGLNLLFGIFLAQNV